MTTITRPQIVLLLSALFPFTISGEPLPEPLTLQAALNTAQNPLHFELLDIDQRLQALRAQLGIEQGGSGFTLDFVGRIRRVGPSDEGPDEDVDDNAASLILSKPLYDFGLQDSRESQLDLQLQALEQQKRLVVEQRRLMILELYFDVLNADNNFISENEALATGFISYDNAVQDQELGLVPEIEVLRLQSEYEMIRQRRFLAEHQQRLTRAILAEAMGYPQQLPSDLEIPEVDPQRRIPDDFEALVGRAFANSLEAHVARINTQAAQVAVSIAQATDNASLNLEFEVSSYQRESRFRDDWRAGLYLQIPIYSGASPARVKLAKAQFNQALASQQQLSSNLRLEVLKLWQQIQQLRLELEGRTIEQDYRDRYLDRSRAEYELEFKTDLGDSMVVYSRSNTERLQTLYAFEVAYQRLSALVGVEFLNQFGSPQ